MYNIHMFQGTLGSIGNSKTTGGGQRLEGPVTMEWLLVKCTVLRVQSCQENL